MHYGLTQLTQVPVNPFDNALAVDQMEVAYSTLLRRSTIAESSVTQSLAKDGFNHPRIVRSICIRLVYSSDSDLLHLVSEGIIPL